MATDTSVFAVITGDVTGSSKVSTGKRGHFLGHLKGLFDQIAKGWPAALRAPFQVYRGDSFQGVLSDATASLKVALFLRAGLRSGFTVNGETVINDARIAIGIGSIDFLPTDSSAEGDGEAFRRSGRLLDRMADPFQLVIETGVKEVDNELNVGLGLLDVIIGKWSPAQAEVIGYSMLGLNQREMARRLDVSSAAVNQRLKTAGARSLDNLMRRFEELIRDKVCSLNHKTIKVEG